MLSEREKTPHNCKFYNFNVVKAKCFHFEKHSVILSLFFNYICEADGISTILLSSLFFVHFPVLRIAFSAFSLM